MSDGRSHKENAPSSGPICARPKLTRSARELRASASPPSATQAIVSRATPPLPKAAPARPLWPPAREPASRPGPRLSSCSPPPSSGGERARTLALRPAVKSRESPRVPRRQKQARPPPARARGAAGSPCWPPASCPPPSPSPPALRAKSAARDSPQRSAEKGRSAGYSPRSRSPAGGTPCERASRSARWPGLPTRSGARPARPRRLPPGTSPCRARSLARPPSRSLARSDSGRGQRLSARGGSRRSA